MIETQIWCCWLSGRRLDLNHSILSTSPNADIAKPILKLIDVVRSKQHVDLITNRVFKDEWDLLYRWKAIASINFDALVTADSTPRPTPQSPHAARLVRGQSQYGSL